VASLDGDVSQIGRRVRKTDIAIFREGLWWRINSGDSTIEVWQFGQAGDIPLPADYTGDGRDELAVYRNGQ